MSESIKKQAVRGAGFQTIGGIIQIAIRLVGSMILARLLTPADFGIFALTTLVFGLFSQFSLLAAPQAIVAKRNISQQHLNSIFLLNIIIHLLISISMFILSNYISVFYDEPKLSIILQILSILTFIKGFSKVSGTLLTRNMHFFYLNIINILSAILEIGVAIFIVVYYKHNFWGLVWGLVIAEMFMTILVIVVAKWKPTFSFSPKAFIYFLRYGAHLTGENIAIYLRQNIDYFVIGKLLGANTLGIYSFAYRIPNLVNARLIGPASGIIIPYMSKLTNDEQTIQASLMFTKFIAYFGFLLLLILFVLAKPIILLMWGEQWDDAIEPMKVLIFASAINMVGIAISGIFLKKSRPDLLMKAAIIKLPASLIIILGMGYIAGLMGIAFGVALSEILAFVISFIYLKKIVQIPTYEFLKNIFPATTISILTALTIKLLYIIIPNTSYLFEIIIISTNIVLIYASLIFFLFHQDYLKIKNLLQNYMKKSIK